MKHKNNYFSHKSKHFVIRGCKNVLVFNLLKRFFNLFKTQYSFLDHTIALTLTSEKEYEGNTLERFRLTPKYGWIKIGFSASILITATLINRKFRTQLQEINSLHWLQRNTCLEIKMSIGLLIIIWKIVSSTYWRHTIVR